MDPGSLIDEDSAARIANIREDFTKAYVEAHGSDSQLDRWLVSRFLPILALAEALFRRNRDLRSTDRKELAGARDHAALLPNRARRLIETLSRDRSTLQAAAGGPRILPQALGLQEQQQEEEVLSQELQLMPTPSQEEERGRARTRRSANTESRSASRGSRACSRNRRRESESPVAGPSGMGTSTRSSHQNEEDAWSGQVSEWTTPTRDPRLLSRHQDQRRNSPAADAGEQGRERATGSSPRRFKGPRTAGRESQRQQQRTDARQTEREQRVSQNRSPSVSRRSRTSSRGSTHSGSRLQRVSADREVRGFIPLGVQVPLQLEYDDQEDEAEQPTTRRRRVVTLTDSSDDE